MFYFEKKNVISSIYCHKFSFQSVAVVQDIFSSSGSEKVNTKLCIFYMKIQQFTGCSWQRHLKLMSPEKQMINSPPKT